MSVTSEQPPGQDEECPKNEEGKIPGHFVCSVADMVKPEKVVVHEALDEIENAPSNEHPPNQGSAAHRLVRRLAASPKQPQSEGDREPRRRVEEPVGKRVRLEPSHRCRRIAPFARQQVMPLQDLVENDPVHEAAQAHAQQ